MGWGKVVPVLELVQSSQLWASDTGDLLSPLPVTQLRVQLGVHQQVDLFDHIHHFGKDLLQGMSYEV